MFSQGKPINTTHLSTFGPTAQFAGHLKKPTSFFLRPKDDIYSLDIDSGDVLPPNAILMELGRSLEKFITLPKNVFDETFLKKDGRAPVDLTNEKEGYRYLKVIFL